MPTAANKGTDMILAQSLKVRVLSCNVALSLLCILPATATASASSATSASSAPTSATFTTEPALAKRLDSAIDKAIASKKIVGTVVIVAKDGKIVYRHAAGLADRENNIAVKPDTIFRLASMSKTIVSVAALSLIQSGKLKLDDPVKKWLPDFQPKLADGSAPVITIRELLTHTAGLDYLFSESDGGPYHKANVSDGMDQPGLGMQENLQRIASCPLLFSPGTRFHYSLSIDVLGAVLEKVAGKPLGEIVKETVTGPLEMTDTAFTVTDKSRTAVPYVDGATEPKRMGEAEIMKSKDTDMHFAPARVFDDKSYPSGGAGLVGTADDYLKLLEAIRTDNEKLLNRQTMFFLKLNQIGDLKAKDSPGWGFGYGSGVLFQAEKKYPYSVGTLEWGGAYGCHWFMDPAQKLSVVELTNTTLEGLFGKYSKDVTNAVYDFTPLDSK
jgi:CubicO group peptidase (beta-lactamase class C family)